MATMNDIKVRFAAGEIDSKSWKPFSSRRCTAPTLGGCETPAGMRL